MSRAATRAEHFRAWIRDGALKPPPGFDPMAQGADAFDRAAKVFQQVFDSGAGETVLEILLDATLRRPVLDHTLEGDAYWRFAQLREGQNSAVAVILTYLDRAEEIDRTQPHDRRSDRGDSGDGSSDGGVFPRGGFYDGLIDDGGGGSGDDGGSGVILR